MKLVTLIEEIDPNLKKNDPSYKTLLKVLNFLRVRKKCCS